MPPWLLHEKNRRTTSASKIQSRLSSMNMVGFEQLFWLFYIRITSSGELPFGVSGVRYNLHYLLLNPSTLDLKNYQPSLRTSRVTKLMIDQRTHEVSYVLIPCGLLAFACPDLVGAC